MTDRTKAMDILIAQDADLIDVPSGVTEADREVLIRISNSDDETSQRIRRGLIYTWEVGEIARHRQQAIEAQAAEIERLKAEAKNAWCDDALPCRQLMDAKQEIERLREAGDNLGFYAGHEDACDCVKGWAKGPCNRGYTEAWQAWSAALGETK